MAIEYIEPSLSKEAHEALEIWNEMKKAGPNSKPAKIAKQTLGKKTPWNWARLKGGLEMASREILTFGEAPPAPRLLIAGR